MNAHEKLCQNLIEYLQNCKYEKTLQELANYFGKCPRTIRKNINKLIEENNAPWMIHQAKVMPDPTKKNHIKLQTYWFDKQELESLFALNSIVEQLAPDSNLKQQLKPFSNRISKIIKNDTNNLAEKIKLIEITGRKVKEQVFQKVSQALIEDKRLQIFFWNRFTDKTSQREISPVTLIRYKDNWLLDAYCHQKQQLRIFSLEAIQKIIITTKIARTIPKKQQTSHYQTSYGIYAGENNKLAVLEFSPYISRWVKDESWHPKQIGKIQQDGSYLIKIPYNQDTELIQQILSHGAEIKVLEPAELKHKIFLELKKIIQIYKGNNYD